LLEKKNLNPKDIEETEVKIKSQIDEAVAFAEKSPIPGMEGLLENVYV
jgi:TPP-dependent pyruvate/acetoin dehydrogenase alpha subunit